MKTDKPFSNTQSESGETGGPPGGEPLPFPPEDFPLERPRENGPEPWGTTFPYKAAGLGLLLLVAAAFIYLR